MTAAVLLDAWGELDFFDCDTCMGAEKLGLGCGRAPRTQAPDTLQDCNEGKSRPRLWSLRLWYEQADLRRMPASAELAEDLYHPADWGSVTKATGTPWRCCPAWYARFSPQGAVDAALHAVKLLRWRENGALGAVASGTLQAWEVDLVEIASKMYASKQRRDDHARAEQAKATARAQGRG